ncbi:MAG: OmpA family protein [Pseudarcicella sp.]|nr:OmpA family protein [Pseudarcicella sp.]
MYAQKIHWASRVIAFSSEFNDPYLGKEFKAIQALGKPSRLPGVGSTACAWQPMTANNPTEEFIIVGFDTLMPIRQVIVAENLGQGSIVKIEAFDEEDNLHVLWQDFSQPTNEIGRILTRFLDQKTTYKVKGIKLVLNTFKVKGFNQIDAIGISDAENSLDIGINIATEIPETLKKEKLNKNINSSYSELTPVVTDNDNMLYFTRDGHPENTGEYNKQDIWYAQKTNNNLWNTPKKINFPINNDENNAICGLFDNGKSMLLNNIYNNDGSITKGFSISRKLSNGDWAKPISQIIDNFSMIGFHTEYAISNDGKTLLITTQTKNTEGGKDIYVSFLKENNHWTKPLNLGPKVNTAENEICPFLSADNSTLYFASKGYPGFGDYDLFMTTRLDNSWTNWTEPKNLGQNINSPNWEGYLSISEENNYGYFSTISADNTSKEDIYKFYIPEKIRSKQKVEIGLKVVSAKSNSEIVSYLSIIDLTNIKDTTRIKYTPQDEFVKHWFDQNKKYQINIEATGYYNDSKILETNTLSETNNTQNEILKINPIIIGEKIRLNKVLFEQSKSKLDTTSYLELNEIVKLMQENKKIKVLLEGHTDNQGDWKSNLQLSEDRVNEVKKYIISQGIDDFRVETKGWGSTKPLKNNKKEINRKENRRVEITILN